MHHFEIEVPELTSISVDYMVLENAQTESPYIDTAVALANVLIQNWYYLLAIREEATCLSRIEAPIYALLIRATKLFHSFVLLTCNLDSVGASFLYRGIMDCLSDARYLIAYYEPELIKDYIMLPLYAECEKLMYFRNLQQQRELLPIENRILRGIEIDLKRSGITEEDLHLTSKKMNQWKKIRINEKLQVHGYKQAYLFGQNTGNNIIHSNWTTLLSQHLVSVSDDQYEPMLESKPCRPQLILSLERLLCETAKDFIEWAFTNKSIVEKLKIQFENTLEIIDKIDSLHEKYLNKRKA